MRLFVVWAASGILACYAWDVRAQGGGSSQSAVQEEVAADVRRAADIAHVKVDDTTVKLLAARGHANQASLDDVYATVDANMRVSRLADYLSAKARTKGPGPRSTLITGEDVGDFHWGYLKNQTQYSPVRLASPEPAQLREVAGVAGRKYHFDSTRATFEPGSVILLPMITGATAAPVTVELNVDKKQVVWTGAPEDGMMRVVLSGTSRGCRIDISSVPSEAKILINGVEWHKLTDTSVIRQPGNVEVTVKKPGYKPWVEVRDLSAGGSWAIKAGLQRE